jgi:diaminohydroxyphosphoribosylaminopyrimidine deaminase / 5-amino-6-(5-phosphoribosylamino)uracil reductase
VRQPARVVFDSAARLPVDSALVRSIGEAPLLVFAEAADDEFTEVGADPTRVEALRAAGAEVIEMTGERGLRLRAALAELGRRGFTSLLVEGGAELSGSFLGAGEVDELIVFIAPKVLGRGKPLAFWAGYDHVGEAPALAVDWIRSGEDMLARARLREW